MLITWNRLGTAANPKYSGGVLTNGKLEVVRWDELIEAICEAWRFFEKEIIPLNLPADWDSIMCYIGFFSAKIELSVFSDNAAIRHVGSCRLVAANMREVWKSAAPLSDNGEHLAFTTALQQQQLRYAEMILDVIGRLALDTKSKLIGKIIRITCDSTKKIIIGKIGERNFYVTALSEFKLKETSRIPSEEAGLIKWDIISDSPGNVIYAGKCPDRLSEEGFHSAVIQMWSVFSKEILPLNDRSSWNHVRCEYNFESESLIIHTANHETVSPLHQGSCTLETGNFIEALREYEESENIDALHKKQIAWSKIIVKCAQRLVAENKMHPLRGTKLEFWDDDETCLYRAQLK